MNQEPNSAADPASGDGAVVSAVRFEHLDDAFGIGSRQPRLSWIVTDAPDGWQQSAYELESTAPDGSPHEQSGRTESRDSVLVAWPFAPLASRERRTVRVRVWGQQSGPSEWSPAATVETGLLDASDWSARFITPDWDEPDDERPVPLLRREFNVRPGVVRARLYVTALGVYEAQLNGTPIGDHVLAPGWTSYNYRLRYQTFDVTGLLQEGSNAIGAMLGDGWYRGRLGFGGGQQQYLRRAQRAAGPARDRATPTARSSAWSPTITGALRRVRCCPAISTTAKPTTRGASSRAGQPPATTTAIGPACEPWSAISQPCSRPPGHRYAAPSCWRRLRSAHRRRVARSSTSARTWLAVCA